MKPVICIAGPTASGKSAFAMDVAAVLDGEIINADALQVYADLQILSARPTQDEMGSIPHHLFGHVSGRVRYSTGHWLREVDPLILDILARGKTPILVGGTGLYFRALLHGMADIPPTPKAIFDDTQSIYDEQGIEPLRALAKDYDPICAQRVLGDDPQRLMRIINVSRATGRPLSEWQENTRPVVPLRFAKYCALTPPREPLYSRINNRYDAMLRGGGMEEAKAIFSKGFDDGLPVMKAIGLRQLRSYFDGQSTLDEAIELAKRDSRRFAKRQMTWFRNQRPKAQTLETPSDKAGFLQSLKELQP